MKKLHAAGVAAAFCASVATALVGVTPADAAGAPRYEAAGVEEPQGPSSQWHLPQMATIKVDGVTRLVRSVTYSTTDGGEEGAGDVLGVRTEYMDLGHGGWRPIADAEKTTNLSMANTVTSTDAAGRTTLNAVLAAGIKDGRPHLATSSTTDGIHWGITASAPVDIHDVHLARGTAFMPYQGVIELPDRSWLMPVYYTKCYGAPGCSLEQGRSTIGLVVSIDRGKTWSLAAEPYASPQHNFSEASVVRRNDGRLTMVARYDSPASQNRLGELVWRTSDKPVGRAFDVFGQTWQAPRILVPGRPVVNGVNQGSSPRLTRVNDQKIMLTYGRPDSVISWNTDGSATSWSQAETLSGLPHPYRNRPTSCRDDQNHPVVKNGQTKIADLPCAQMGTSGYMGVAITDPTTATGYISGDTCHVWSCEPADNPWRDVSWQAADPSAQKVWMVRFQG